jgi:16S rRNA (uracil1498-N3)-methyltransferase
MTVPRLHCPGELATGQVHELSGERAHYLRHVLRLREGGVVHLFNAEAGEWRAEILRLGRHGLALRLAARTRAPAPEPGPTLAFAPIKRPRLEWLVEKAVELGAARLVPVITRRTVARPERADRLLAIATEAAEQCERLSVPAIDPPRPLTDWLDTRAAVPLLFADERGEGAPVLEACRRHPDGELLVGPEGGFAPEERARLLALPGTVPISLGPRILRAETAALHTLVAWQLGHLG